MERSFHSGRVAIAVLVALTVATAAKSATPNTPTIAVVANGCLVSDDRSIKIGTPVTLISVDPDGHTHFQESKISAASCTRVGEAPVEPGYQLNSADAEGVGIVGSLSTDGLTLTECASQEGFHRNLWATKAGKRSKIWHGYRYLGYAARPDCSSDAFTEVP